ncbi:MAG: biotin--[acetyl-CoA-carboxylase] ligase, partial [Solirubrobacterales bacterium]|nr:biotin--[acetyl-CoA-carboxylase] ligase [Solirubrobacterales bacterium]
HLREVGSTNARARELAMDGAPHGTLVTATAQVAGRGRQGRSWSAPPGRSLVMSVVLRDPPRLLPLAAGVAVARAIGDDARIKWPNDVQIDGRKVAGILVEGRPQEGWAVVGVGVNVAVDLADLPDELRETAGTLGLAPTDVDVVLARLLAELGAALASTAADLLDAWRERDALRGQRIAWAAGEGVARGIDGDGRLVVERDDGARVALDAGEVHLRRR